MDEQFVKEIEQSIGAGRVKREEPMKRHTTFRIGGPAELFVSVDGSELPQVVKLCAKYGVSYCVIGNGSNLLVSDRGIRGLVIQMSGKGDGITVTGSSITAGAGVLLSQVAHTAAEYGLSGMEFAAGIPGSVGGAVVMNAGAYGGEMKDIIRQVTVMDRDGGELVLDAGQLDLSYRHSCIPQNGYIVTRVVMDLEKGDKDEILVRMSDLKKQRLAKQPLEYASAGSTFKRPEGYFAGKLIMEAGLRGYQVGDAQVSEKHCGFVINRGAATAREVSRLIQDVSSVVEKNSGVRLEPEVKFLGEFS